MTTFIVDPPGLTVDNEKIVSKVGSGMAGHFVSQVVVDVPWLCPLVKCYENHSITFAETKNTPKIARGSVVDSVRILQISIPQNGFIESIHQRSIPDPSADQVNE